MDAARLSGMSDFNIMTSVILGMVLALIVANGILQVTASIVAEAALDFIGIGVLSLTSWGTMLYWAEQFAFFYGAWWWTRLPEFASPLLGIALFWLDLHLKRSAIRG